MLDNQTTQLLRKLNEICKDGAYKVLEKEDIINSFSKIKVDEDSLKDMIEHLQERNYLNVKYSDDKVYCLAVMPKGRLFDEKSKELTIEKKKNNKLIAKTMTLSCVASFVGAFLAMIIFNLIF